MIQLITKNTNLNVKLTKHRNSAPNFQNNYLTKTGLTTTAVNLTLVSLLKRGKVSNERCQEVCKQFTKFGQTCAPKHLPGY